MAMQYLKSKIVGAIVENRLLLLLAAIVLITYSILYPSAPKNCAYSDECGYVNSAYDISKHFVFNTRGYYFDSLLTQTPPLKRKHAPGFAATLALFIKVFGAREKHLFLFNFIVLGFFIIFFYYFNNRYISHNKELSFIVCAVFLSYPHINLTNIMRESLVTVSTGLLIYLMFFYVPERKNLKSFIVCAVLFWYCYLVKENVLFLLPGFVLIYLKEKDYEIILKTTIALLIFYPVVHFITENRMVYPYGFMYKLHNTEEFFDKLSLLFGNFYLNVTRIWDFNHTPLYLWMRILFYQFSIFSLLSYPLLKKKQRYLYKVVMLYFLINTFMIYLLYDNFSWRFLRSSIQFVPFHILFAVTGGYNILVSGKERYYKFIFYSVIIALMCECVYINFHSRHSANIHKITFVKQERSKLNFLKKYIDKDDAVNILTDIKSSRFLMEFPRSTITCLYGLKKFNSTSFNMVNRKIGFDYIFLTYRMKSTIGFILDSGYKMTKDGNVYILSRRKKS